MHSFQVLVGSAEVSVAAKVLDARDPAQVESVHVIDADLGVGGRRLIVASGIARYEWSIDTDETAQGQVQVRLGIFARDLEQVSPTVGLAAIAADETEYVFAIDSASVDIDPTSGELVLSANTALMGEAVWFYRFSYQVVATIVRAVSEITGDITWPTALMRPDSDDVGLVAPHLRIQANQYAQVPGGGLFGMVEQLTPVVGGAVISVDVGEGSVVAKYRIDNPPMAMPLKVTLQVLPSFANRTVLTGRTGGPDVFTLTPQNPSETVDFGIGPMPDIR